MTYFTESILPGDNPSGNNGGLWRRLTDSELESAKALVSGVAPDAAPELRRDMIQFAQYAYLISGSRDVFLGIPHTGYALYYNITPAINP